MPTAVANIQPRLQVRYRETIAEQLRQEFGYDNVMQVPKLTARLKPGALAKARLFDPARFARRVATRLREGARG